MKSKEEIEKLAEQLYPKPFNPDSILQLKGYREAYTKGYTQCQEDMADKKYNLDDMKKACTCGIDIVCKEGPNDFQPFADLINSLNKQD